jgi:hypothetical protein
MKTIQTIFAALVLLTSQLAYSHGSHAPVMNEAQIMALGVSAASQFSTQDTGLPIGKLPESWASLKENNVSIHKKGRGYYILKIENGADERTLYVLVSNAGRVYDANFTGAFKDIK